MSDPELTPPETEFVRGIRKAASLRILSGQALAVFLGVGAISAVAVAIIRLAKPGWKPNPILIFVFIFLLTLEIVVWLAYRRGVRDARSDAKRKSAGE